MTLSSRFRWVWRRGVHWVTSMWLGIGGDLVCARRISVMPYLPPRALPAPSAHVHSRPSQTLTTTLPCIDHAAVLASARSASPRYSHGAVRRESTCRVGNIIGINCAGRKAAVSSIQPGDLWKISHHRPCLASDTSSQLSAGEPPCSRRTSLNLHPAQRR